MVGGALAEDVLDGLGFKGVAEWRRGGVGVDVVDLVGRDARDLERMLHGAVAAFAFGSPCRSCEGIGGEAIAE